MRQKDWGFAALFVLVLLLGAALIIAIVARASDRERHERASAAATQQTNALKAEIAGLTERGTKAKAEIASLTAALALAQRGAVGSSAALRGAQRTADECLLREASRVLAPGKPVISSPPILAPRVGGCPVPTLEAVRKHWGIAGRLYWAAAPFDLAPELTPCAVFACAEGRPR